MDNPFYHPLKHPHIHTPECVELWWKYNNCKSNNNKFKLMFLDSCGKAFSDLSYCYKKERIAKREHNGKIIDKESIKLLDKLAKTVEP